MLVEQKMSVAELCEKIGITVTNLSIPKIGKAKAIRFSTLETTCKALDYQQGDILNTIMTKLIKDKLYSHYQTA